jgi:hypothetical protein
MKLPSRFQLGLIGGTFWIAFTLSMTLGDFITRA